MRAAVATEAILLEASRFVEVMSSHDTVRGKIDARLMDRMKVNKAMEVKTESGNLITFLMAQGVGEATDVLLIDESLASAATTARRPARTPMTAPRVWTEKPAPPTRIFTCPLPAGTANIRTA